jgi:transposase
LLKADVLQISLFDSELCDVEDGGKRYVFRRNPMRAQEIEQVRTEKEQKVRDAVSARNKYLQEHARAKQETQLNIITALIKKLRLEQWMSITVSGRTLQLSINYKARQECSELDGCYVLKTDLKKEDADTKTVHDRYKDLAFVEDAFRTMKTAHLEMRPVHVRSEKSTRGHVLVTMLAYKIIRTLTTAWKEEDCTVSESIAVLAQLCAVHITVGGGSCLRVPQPCVVSARLLNALGITLPDVLPARTVRVGMRKKW